MTRKVELEVIDPLDVVELESEPLREESNCFDEGVSSELFEFREQDCIFNNNNNNL